jgi:hypothetical protein
MLNILDVFTHECLAFRFRGKLSLSDVTDACSIEQ